MCSDWVKSTRAILRDTARSAFHDFDSSFDLAEIQRGLQVNPHDRRLATRLAIYHINQRRSRQLEGIIELRTVPTSPRSQSSAGPAPLQPSKGLKPTVPPTSLNNLPSPTKQLPTPSNTGNGRQQLAVSVTSSPQIAEECPLRVTDEVDWARLTTPLATQ